MKKLFLLTKTLLVAVMLLAGTNAWADTTTETYSFAQWVKDAGGDVKPSYESETAVTINSSACKAIASTLNGHSFNGRFAVSQTNTSNMYFRLRNSSVTDSYTGYFVAVNRSSYFSILNLLEGDKVTITFNNNPDGNVFWSTNATYDNSGTPTAITTSTKPVSGTEYTMTADGHLDMYLTAYASIKEIVIVTSAAETMNAPTIAVTGANGNERTITITPGEGTAGSAATATYYTTDGTTPSSSNGTAYTKPFTINETKTIKAISYLSTTAGEVATKEIEAGTPVTLNAPSISLDFVLSSGVYKPVYSFTSDQSSKIGTPTATIEYSLDGGETYTEAASYTSTAAGTLTVRASASGYTSATTTISIVGGDFINSYSFDAINDVERKEGITWGSATNVGGAQWTFASLENFTYTLRADITLTGLSYARATTADTNQGFYARSGDGSIGFTLAGGEYIMFTTRDGNVVASSSVSSQSFGKFSNIRAINVYKPVVTATIGENGYATFSSTYALDFTGVTEATAYIANNKSSNNIQMKSVTGKVAANTGLVLKSANGSEATVQIPVTTETGTYYTRDSETKNYLVGCSSNTTINKAAEGTNYVLTVQEINAAETVVWAPIDGTSATVTANHAYLWLPAEIAAQARSLRMVFDGDVITGISEAKAEAAEKDGKFVINGQLVIKKNGKMFNANGAQMK